jgi:hypothetical protein
LSAAIRARWQADPNRTDTLSARAGQMAVTNAEIAAALTVGSVVADTIKLTADKPGTTPLPLPSSVLPLML